MSQTTDSDDFEEQAYWAQYDEPGEGESYDRAGNIRPVPAGVPPRPDE